MDPLTVLSIAGVAGATAKAAWNVVEGLHAFFSGISHVDQTVNGLIAEVKALSRACACVDQRLHDIVRDYEAEVRLPRTDQGKLWACIKAQVQDSKDSIAQLEAAFNVVQKERTTKLSQAWRQFMVNIQAKDINEARNRLQSHTTSLQTILQTVAIEICYLAPQRADQQLRTLLSAVNECKAQLRALRQERTGASQNNQTTEIEILKVCEDAVSSGESLYAASVAEGSQARFSVPRPGLDNVQQWMADLCAIEETVSGPSTTDLESSLAVAATGASPAGVEGESQRKESRVSTSVSETSNRHLMSPPTDELETDSDDDFEVELAQEALNAAKLSFDSNEYQEADAYLQEALRMVRELPASRQGICDTWDIRYMLSVCAYHSQRPAEAEAKLLSVIDTTSRSRTASEDQLRQVCEAGHLLSQLFIKLGNLDHAHLYCKNALKGRQRLLGKSHADTYQSLALMARIFQLQDNKPRASIYLRFIDETKREELERNYSELAFDTAVSEAYASAKLKDEPKSTTVVPPQVEHEGRELNSLGSVHSSEAVESMAPVAIPTSYWKELRPADSLSVISTTTKEMSTVSTSSLFSGDFHTVSTTMSSQSTESLPQAASCIIVIRTRFGDFSVAVSTNLKETSNTFSPGAWNAFNNELVSGVYNDLSLRRQEKRRGIRLGTFIEGTSAKDLKLTINPSTKDFILEQKKTRTLRVEGRVYAGKEMITKIMMFKPGIRKGGSVDVVSLQIREAA